MQHPGRADQAVGDPGTTLDVGRHPRHVVGQDRPRPVVQLKIGPTVASTGQQDVTVGFEVRLRASDVLPVAVQVEGPHLAPFDERGQQPVAEVAQFGAVVVNRQLFEDVQHHLGVVDEDLGGHPAVSRVVGLDRDTGDPALGDLQDGVVARPLRGDGGRHHRRLRPVGPVVLHHAGVVELVDVVGAHHQQGLRPLAGDQLSVRVQRVGIPGMPARLTGGLLLRRDHAQATVAPVEVPGPAAGQHVQNALRLVLDEHPDVIDPAVPQVGEGEVQQAIGAGERERRLGAIVGEHAHTTALATGEHQREDVRSAHPAILWAPTRRRPLRFRRAFPESRALL